MTLYVGSRAMIRDGAHGIITKAYGGNPPQVKFQMDDNGSIVADLNELIEEEASLPLQVLADGCELDPAADGPEVDILRAADHGHMTQEVAVAALEGIYWSRRNNRG